MISLYVTMDHKTSHKGQFFEFEIYTSSESWINKLSIDVWFVRIGQYLAENCNVNYIITQLQSAKCDNKPLKY